MIESNRRWTIGDTWMVNVKDVFSVVSMPRSPRYREAAFAAIKEAALEGRISAGAPLVEGKIASALGMSRTPVREALALLEHEGLIAHQLGIGSERPAIGIT